MIISTNGKIVDVNHTSIPVISDAFLYGFAVFEMIRTYHHKFFRLSDHLARLFLSSDVIGMKSKWTFNKAYDAVVRALEYNKDANAKIRVILTSNDLIITVEKHKPKPAYYYKKGVALVSYIGRRNIPHAKLLTDTFCYLAKRHALKCGAFEALLVDPKMFVRECAYSNIFWVKHGKLYTTNKDILYGITRDTVIELAKKCHFTGIQYKALIRADEIFVTQTSGGIIPVVQIDDHKIGNGKPGLMTKKLMASFEQLIGGKMG